MSRRISKFASDHLSDTTWLTHQYVTLHKGGVEISNFLGCNYKTVYRRLDAIGIPRRPLKVALALVNSTEEHKAKLRAAHLGVPLSSAHRKSLSVVMKKRIANPIEKAKIDSALEKGRIDKGIRQRAISALRSPDCRYQNSMRAKKQWAETDIAQRLSVAHQRPETREKFAIIMKKHWEDPEYRANRTGEKHANWKGGTSFEPYCPKFNDEFKEYIREKFGRKCYLCGSSENGTKLHVHHIDYNKNSICNGKEWAFVPLCASHHSASNHNRWYWFNLLINYWGLNSEINFLTWG